MQQLILDIASDHPAYAGHFPGNPVLPGVVLLDHAMLAIEAATGLQLAGLALAKFHSPVSPGQALQLAFRHDAALVAFTISHQERKVADGKFTLAGEQA
ncbi:beta-hydroxyacyl-ACP dehydratase [Vogesella oryzae]|uniref:beta-hydroxyacyl-ACP dehydratase n=1 Tax=Vogesella oryzae TaxID=1735285 RepID=UPI0015830566|nr:beta-hydroxyacyl-ACP dehydratase [Vogesella oryzae]